MEDIQKRRARQLKLYWKNPEKMRAIARKSYHKNSKRSIKYSEKYYKSHKIHANTQMRSRYKLLKLVALIMYGGFPPMCKYCATENDLVIDHRDNKGHLDKDRFGWNAFLIRIIHERDFEKYQVLCRPCNTMKAKISASKRLKKIKIMEELRCQKKM